MATAMKRLFLKFGVAASLMLCGGAASAAEPAWHVYTDPAHGFSISYPDGWTVNPQFADRGYAYAQGDTDDVRMGVGLSPTGDLAPGTNLESKQLMIAVETARPGDSCRARAFLADPSPAYFTQVVEDTPDLAHTLAETDLYDSEHVVRIVSRTPCIAVQVFVVSARIQQGDPQAPKPFDRAALFELVSRIAATFTPPK
jgi:hypothetical protein